MKVWQLADIRKEGRLDKEGFVIAMSLISLAQQGKRLGLEALRTSGTHLITLSLITPPLTPHNSPHTSQIARHSSHET